jgi:hypothetical protein
MDYIFNLSYKLFKKILTLILILINFIFIYFLTKFIKIIKKYKNNIINLDFINFF